MSNISVRTWFGVHTGGTKFYQVFAISSEDSTHAMQINHYGSYDHGDCRPIDVGQLKKTERRSSEVHWECDRTLKSKGKPHGADRGYYRFGAAHDRNFTRQEDFQLFLQNNFKRADADAIFMVICGSAPSPATLEAPTETSEADLAHLFGKPTPKIEEPSSENSEWATW